jgi:hypothetical protein
MMLVMPKDNLLEQKWYFLPIELKNTFFRLKE